MLMGTDVLAKLLVDFMDDLRAPALDLIEHKVNLGAEFVTLLFIFAQNDDVFI